MTFFWGREWLAHVLLCESFDLIVVGKVLTLGGLSRSVTYKSITMLIALQPTTSPSKWVSQSSLVPFSTGSILYVIFPVLLIFFCKVVSLRPLGLCLYLCLAFTADFVSLISSVLRSFSTLRTYILFLGYFDIFISIYSYTYLWY